LNAAITFSPLPEHVEDVLLIAVVVHLAVNSGYLVTPSAPLRMLHIHNVVMRPVEIVGDEADLLIQPIDRIG